MWHSVASRAHHGKQRVVLSNHRNSLNILLSKHFDPRPGAHPQIFKGGVEFFKKHPVPNCSYSQTGFRGNSCIVTTFAYSKIL